MRTWMCLIVVLAVACGGKKKDNEGGGGSGPGTGSAPVAKVDDGSVAIFVDDKQVATLAAKDLAAWPRLDSLVPQEARRLGTWEALGFTTVTGSPPRLAKPAQSHPDMVPVVYPGKDGKPAFGMFDAVEYAKKGEAGFKVEGVREVKLTLSKMERGGEHQGGGGEGADITKLVLTIATKDGEKKLTGPEILKLPREAQPGSEDTKGWRVTQFLEAVGVTKFDSITLVDVSGATVPLTKKELDPATANPFVKLNKSGVLRFRMFTKQGEGWQPGADLRGLTKIEVK